jgi:dCTP diphosphatase
MGFDLTDAAERARSFSVTRDWEQFHSLKNLSMALTGEVGELVEIVQWLNDGEIQSLLATPEGRARIEEEVADITIYLLRIVQQTGIDLSKAIERKFVLNESRYPVERSRGSSAKYKD